MLNFHWNFTRYSFVFVLSRKIGTVPSVKTYAVLIVHDNVFYVLIFIFAVPSVKTYAVLIVHDNLFYVLIFIFVVDSMPEIGHFFLFPVLIVKNAWTNQNNS